MKLTLTLSPEAKGEERPILFSGPMVRAILEGRKTQTRRVVKPQPTYICHDWQVAAEVGDEVIYNHWPHRLTESRGRNKAAAGELTPVRRRCPYGQSGTRLWVRETWMPIKDGTIYRASWDESRNQGLLPSKWRPSIHMPRLASRIRLEVEGVRVERLQDIKTADVIAEGVQGVGCGADASCLYDQFTSLWNAINGPRGYTWEANPWVWVVTFRLSRRGSPPPRVPSHHSR